MPLAQIDKTDQAVQWLFGLEGPALIIALIVLVAVGWAYYYKDKELNKLQEAFRGHMLEESKSRREDLTSVLSAMSTTSQVLETLKGHVIDGTGQVVTGITECSGKLDNVASDIRRALDKS